VAWNEGLREAVWRKARCKERIDKRGQESREEREQIGREKQGWTEGGTMKRSVESR
jgi:hypothetical protein